MLLALVFPHYAGGWLLQSCPFQIKAPGGLTRVQMVDLAGSEREPPSSGEGPVDVRAEQQGRGSKGKLVLSQRLRETAQIKKALSNLGVIIKGLSRGNTPVGMPFRDSILTWLLKVNIPPVSLSLSKSFFYCLRLCGLVVSCITFPTVVSVNIKHFPQRASFL